MASSTPESERLEELFKYFQPASAASGLVTADIDSPGTYNPSTARLCADSVLNSLCRAGIQHLDADRAFVSLIDNQHQYIITEMTSTISLVDSNIHAPDDGLCIGTVAMDLFSGVCAGTMHAFTSKSDRDNPYISTSNIYADQTRYIINDFTLEAHYRHRPYVTSWPHMRYYAEVPIKSSTGYVLGTYSIVDDKPRCGLTDDQFRAMTEISAAIMRHLEMVKMVDDYARSTRLLQGLNSFVMRKNKVASVPSHENIMGRPHIKHDRPSPHETEPPLKRLRTSSISRSKSAVLDRSSTQDYDTNTETVSTALQPRQDARNPLQPTPNHNNVSCESTLTQGSKPSNLEDTATTEATVDDETAQQVVTRAAKLLREAMDLDGVVCLDCPQGEFGRGGTTLSGFTGPGPSHRASIDSRAADSKMAGSEQVIVNGSVSQNGSNPRTSSSQTFCSQLGCSMRSSGQSEDGSPLLDPLPLPFDLHQRLIRQYRRGHVFRFDQSFSRSRISADCPKDPALTPLHSREMSFGAAANTYDQVRLERDLHLYFGQATTLIFMPLRNPYKGTWFASLFGWSTCVKRFIEPDDFSYFSAFGNSMMAEISRLDLLATNRAKSDFISCISHELRSPLHGILGSAELLREMNNSQDQLQMISMVESCARTLLDTMEHVLQFSKISSTKPPEDNPAPTLQKSDSTATTVTALKDEDAFDLSTLTEEAVDSLVAGHQYHMTSEQYNYIGSRKLSSASSVYQDAQSEVPQPPIVILSMDRNTHWLRRSETSAWRRCILNVLGNALKYTAEGMIEIRLYPKASHPTEVENTKDTITLEVGDTGCGISEDYLRHHLFRPFMQENHFSSGTGLGLSIVKSLTESMAGEVAVQSEIGIGTQVMLNIPLRLKPSSDVAEPENSDLGSTTMCFLGFDIQIHDRVSLDPQLSVQEKCRTALKHALKIHAEEWLNVETFSATETTKLQTIQANIITVLEEDLAKLGLSNTSTWETELPSGSSLLVICTRHSSKDRIQHLKSRRATYLMQPFGPRQMKETIEAALSKGKPVVGGEQQGIEPADAGNMDFKYTTLASAPTTDMAQKDEGAMHIPERLHSPLDQAKGPHLLLVDDNEVNMKLLVKFAERLGYEYTTAMDGVEAVEAYIESGKPFDFVFMDISMPRMDGYEATRRIRQYEEENERPTAKIIAMTGLGSNDSKQEAFSNGVDLFWTKPVKLAMIKDLIREYVESG